MPEPVFLSFEQVAEIHHEAIAKYGAMIAIAEKRMTRSALAELFRKLFRR